MKLDQNIKDAIKASVGILAIVVLIVTTIQIYDVMTYNEAEENYRFLYPALILHENFDENEVRDDILNLIDNISSIQIENPQKITSALDRGSTLMRYYKEGYYIYASTEEMRAIKESLVEEGSLFLRSYFYLRKAWESKNNNNYNAYLSNMEQAIQCLDDAMNLRVQNGVELDQWKIKTEAELSK